MQKLLCIYEVVLHCGTRSEGFFVKIWLKWLWLRVYEYEHVSMSAYERVCMIVYERVCMSAYECVCMIVYERVCMSVYEWV